MTDEKSNYGAELRSLAEFLSAFPEITRHDSAEEKEAWTLAHAFLDLKKSFERLSDELLPKLTEGRVAPDEIKDVMLEIGEEFRHILYHIRDPKYFRYLE